MPSCARCARAQGAILQGVTATLTKAPPPPVPLLDVDGYPVDDPVWDQPWIAGLRDVPADATWPRLMTPPHPAAKGSYGADLAAYAQARTGRPLRWWQALTAARLLEHDDAGALVWDNVDVTVARQVGKSYLLRELCMWRIHQGARFGEAQLVVHTGKDLNVCVEIQRPARRWARATERADTYKVRDANGQEQIELLADGSRWMVRAKDGVYGLSASLAVVDEAWAVPSVMIEEGLVPTMVELASAQLLLVSTAHRKATALMARRRAVMLADPADTTHDLWIEWSAPAAAALDDEQGWRMASPHWTQRRRKMIGDRLAAARAGSTDDDDEPDPESAFVAQWLNRWPTRRESGRGEPLLGQGVWQACAGALDVIDETVAVVALEENRGEGAAVAFTAGDGNGRFELDGYAKPTWTEAIALARTFVDAHPGCRIIVGARLNNQLPSDFPGRDRARKAGTTETGRGLVLLRALAAEGRIVHDDTVQLDEQVGRARVYPLSSGGLGLVNNGARRDLLNAALFALDAAQTTQPAPAVH